MEELPLAEIWKLTDPVEFVIQMNIWVGEKCGFGKRLEALSEAERIFFVNIALENEVNNGGFEQFLFNSSGAFVTEVERSMRAIGADATADICKRVVEAFGQPLPQDQQARSDLLDEIYTDEIEAIVDECDNTFYRESDNLAALNYQYVMEHRDQFTE